MIQRRPRSRHDLRNQSKWIQSLIWQHISEKMATRQCQETAVMRLHDKRQQQCQEICRCLKNDSVLATDSVKHTKHNLEACS
jgi:hypothetical protein